jgi:hypothetical protein
MSSQVEPLGHRAANGTPRPKTAPPESLITPQRSWTIAAALYLAVTLVCVATTSSARLETHTPFNHFALLADAWLHGRLDLGGPPPSYTGNNDFAVFDGKYYVSFPPLPALLILPIVKLFGSAERVRDGAFFACFTGLAPAFLYLSLDKLRRLARSTRSERENIFLALIFAFGSVYWFSAVQGTVWFVGHVLGAALAAMYMFASTNATHPILAGLTLSLGFATRTPLGFAFPLFVWEALQASRNNPHQSFAWEDLDVRALSKRVVLFALPAAAVLAVVAWHNKARFGDPFEFGHHWLAIGWRGRIDKWGLFSYHYLGKNLGIVLSSLPFVGGTNAAPFQINAHGLALWVTTPIYAWAFWPRRTSPAFWAVVVTTACIALPDLLYQNSGWIQFGYRFSNDFAIFLFALIAMGKRRFSTWFWGLALIGIVINAFGALTFQRAGYERFYFVDPTQKIVHQPD